MMKNRLLTTMAIAGLSMLALSGKSNAGPVPSLDKGLVSYYSFEGNARDSQGLNHGVNNGASYVDGKVGEALSFDGVDDFVRVPGHSSLDLDRLSLSAWFNADHQTAGHLIGKGQNMGDDLSYRLYLVHMDSGRGDHVVTGDNWTNENGREWTGFPYPRNEWNHVAFTYDGRDQILYLNGKEVDRAMQSGTTRTTDVGLLLGCRLFGDQRITHYEGLMDEVGIWNRSLSADEVRQLWANGRDVEIPEPTAIGLLGLGVLGLAANRRRKK